MNIKHNIILLSVLAAAQTAAAETVLLYEDFNGDYTDNFPYVYDADHQTPHQSIAPLFYSNTTGTTMPWWVCKDSNHAIDKFMASHSYYADADKSNDWLISAPLTISSAGFKLDFDAQSVRVRDMDHISDLALFITDDLLDVNNIPTEPTHVFESVPYGNDPDNCEGDWTHYTYTLDEYVGQTVYINFVNINEDKDILCIDNVKVSRNDPTELTIVPYDAYTLDDTSEIGVTVTCVDVSGLKGAQVTVYVNGEVSGVVPLADMSYGDAVTVTWTFDIPAGDNADFEMVLDAPGMVSLSVGGRIGHMAFEPVHRVFFEETTSLYCGNCPMGMYVVESMYDDPKLADRIVPVSVHIASMGYDPMATSDYYPHLPMSTAAPLVFIERSQTYDGFVPAYDMEYDSANPKSFAYRIDSIANTSTLMDIDVSAEWVIEGADTTGVKCTAAVVPAVNISGKGYRVAFVLTENNVGMDNNPYWMQQNYLSGADYKSRAGGWCDLSDKVFNARYHDVARAISQYEGHAESLPADMLARQQYEYSYTMALPQTAMDNNGYHMSEAIRTEFCEVSAILIDAETGLVVNAARVPMSEIANKRFTARDLVDSMGISDITVDGAAGDAEYYDIYGRRLDAPARGLVISRTAAGISKVIIK